MFCYIARDKDKAEYIVADIGGIIHQEGNVQYTVITDLIYQIYDECYEIGVLSYVCTYNTTENLIKDECTQPTVGLKIKHVAGNITSIEKELDRLNIKQPKANSLKDLAFQTYLAHREVRAYNPLGGLINEQDTSYSFNSSWIRWRNQRILEQQRNRP